MNDALMVALGILAGLVVLPVVVYLSCKLGAYGVCCGRHRFFSKFHKNREIRRNGHEAEAKGGKARQS